MDKVTISTKVSDGERKHVRVRQGGNELGLLWLPASVPNDLLADILTDVCNEYRMPGSEGCRT